ncbi:MAG: phosphoglucosamine mutase [Opitutus sp.]|nr:phosphoglucosamine mutase [Opitutus sp.]
MSRQYFGTDGVRGPYGGPVINDEFAERLGFAAARWLRGAGTVVIGRDTRQSGPALEAALTRGLVAGGVEVVSLGVLPTPAVSRAVRVQQRALGVVVTASHNPAEDNGIKFFGAAGLKLTDAQEEGIEKLIPERVEPVSGPGRDEVRTESSGSADYVATMCGLLRANVLHGWRIVLDTANGATCATSPVVLRALGAEVISLGDAPDGKNINAGIGSEHPEKLAALVRERGARIGIAHDGDGDRCILCDEQGNVLDGDEILTILATHALRRGTLTKNTLVVTVQSNLGVDAAIAAAGGRVCRTPVGDRYVIERMRAEGATLGGESSGHIVCADISPTGDGLLAALKVIDVMLETGEPLSALRRRLKKFPQKTAALRVAEKRPLEELRSVSAATAELEAALGERGRVMVRYSGTEAKIRLLIEGPDDATVSAGIKKLETAVRADLQVL